MTVFEPFLSDRLRPLDSPKLSDEAFLILREAIINGKFPPGTRLVEQSLAQQLGISRIPVREAIQQLVDEGLVVKEPRRGAYVQSYSDAELEEVYSLRVVLEGFVIERVMANWSDQARAELQVIVDRMTQAAQAGDKKLVSDLDTKFHETLWELANHQILLEVVSSLRIRITHFLVKANAAISGDAVDAHVQSHQILLDCLNSGDVEAAKAKITEHILGGKRRIKTVYKTVAEDNYNGTS